MDRLKEIRFISTQGAGIKSDAGTITLSTVEECLEWCKKQDVIGVDTETEGLDHVTKRVIMLQLGNEEMQWVIDTRGLDISILGCVFSSTDILKVYQNAKFDVPMLRASFGFINEHVYDTMVVEQVMYTGYMPGQHSYSLKSLVKQYLGIEMDKDVRNQFIELKGKPYTFTQILYGANDVKYLPQIREKQMEIYTKEKYAPTVDLENEAVLAFADIQYNGIKLDQQEWKKLAVISKKEQQETEDKMDELVLNDTVLGALFKKRYLQGDLFASEEDLRKVDIEWSSPTQVLKVFKRINANIESVSALELFKYQKEHPLIALFGQYQKLKKKVTSYGTDFLKLVRKDGRIHTRFNQVLNTGRVSSADPNMQQIPASNTYRNCFLPNYPDWVFVSADYSSQELCFIAEKSKDPVWIAALDAGHDLHSICADLVFKDKWKQAAETDCVYMTDKEKCECPGHKKLRTFVKAINFGLAYGMSEFKLSDTMDSTVEEAKALIEEYFKTFPKISGLLNFLGKFGLEHGYIQTFAPYYRRRYFTNYDPENPDFKVKGQIERASKNTPIQGGSADMTKLAMVYIRREIIDNNWPVEMVMTVHDQIDTIVHKDRAEEWALVMKDLMEKAGKVILPSGRLKAEVTISNRWEK